MNPRTKLKVEFFLYILAVAWFIVLADIQWNDGSYWTWVSMLCALLCLESVEQKWKEL